MIRQVNGVWMFVCEWMVACDNLTLDAKRHRSAKNPVPICTECATAAGVTPDVVLSIVGA